MAVHQMFEMPALDLFDSQAPATLAPVKRAEKGVQPGSRQPEAPVPAPPSSSAPPAAPIAPSWQASGPLDVHFSAFVATCRGWGVASRVVDPETGKGDPTRARRWANYLLRGVESDRPASFDAARWAAAIAALPCLFAHLVERPGEPWEGVEE